ncbi:MAG: PilZ domain-containing protein [Gammaproteobacteria bacterium]|nr:MAG: PilZ domain-containing protein [Gammaproteobacteria bacterium]
MAILQSMWKKLSGKHSLGETAQLSSLTTPLTLASVSSINQTKEPGSEKYSSLYQLLNQRQIIEVKIEGSSLSYQTLVLAIDMQRGVVWLDDLFPTQHMLEIGDLITVKHHRSGEQLSFSSPVLAWGNDYGANGLAILLPQQALYSPRRKSSRADMSEKSNVSLKLRAVGHEPLYASVLDISSGGLRASVPGNLLGQLRHGALLPLCELTLSDELTIRCSARVRGFRLLRSPHRHTQISIEFVDLPVERQQQLQQFINNVVYLYQPEQRLRSA